MPTYEYKCTECGHVFSAFQSMNDEPLDECVKCGARARKVFGNAGIIFKGSGFYVNDYKSGGSSTSTSGKKEAACSAGCESCSSAG